MLPAKRTPPSPPPQNFHDSRANACSLEVTQYSYLLARFDKSSTIVPDSRLRMARGTGKEWKDREM